MGGSGGRQPSGPVGGSQKKSHQERKQEALDYESSDNDDPMWGPTAMKSYSLAKQSQEEGEIPEENPAPQPPNNEGLISLNDINDFTLSTKPLTESMDLDPSIEPRETP